MKRSLLYLLTVLLFAVSCQREDPSKKPISVLLKLDFDTEMTQWHYSEEDAMIVEETSQGDTYDNIVKGAAVRYIVMAVPANGGDAVRAEFTDKAHRRCDARCIRSVVVTGTTTNSTSNYCQAVMT